MDERELSKLSFLVQALARTPEKFVTLLGLTTRDTLIEPSTEFQIAVNELRRLFASEFPRQTSLSPKEADAKVARIAALLLDSANPPLRSAGRSLAWAIENRGGEIRSSR